MQYWIFYTGGVGGDGFCNLLEHADNMTPADLRLEWRIHNKEGRDYENTVKFYGPHWSMATRGHPFRRYDRVVPLDQIGKPYLDLIEHDRNTVIPCHTDVYFAQINECPYKDIVQKNQIKIHVYSLDFDRVNDDLIMKTGIMPASNGNAEINKRYLQEEIEKYHNSGKFDYEVDIERVWRSWDYFANWLGNLGLTMNKKYYDEYIALVNPDRILKNKVAKLLQGPPRTK